MEENDWREKAAQLLIDSPPQHDAILATAPSTTKPNSFLLATQEIRNRLQTQAPPTEFAIMALARHLVLGYSSGFSEQRSRHNIPSTKPGSQGNPLVKVGLGCLGGILIDLQEKDSRLCCTALRSLNSLLEEVGPGEGGDWTQAGQGLLEALITLWSSPIQEVAALAGTTILSLVLAMGVPEFYLRASHAFLSGNGRRKILLPNAYVQLCLSHRARLAGHSSLPSWSTTPLHKAQQMVELCLRRPSTLSPDEDPAMLGCIAVDGEFVYVLSPYGLMKIGTGFGESEAGKEYAWNDALKPSPNTTLTVCRGSLYLRRRNSSRVWVLDKDSLREIGEILLPTNTVPGLLCSDGSNFFTLTADSDGNIVGHMLEENFAASERPPLKWKVSKTHQWAYGEREAVDALPEALAEQTVDIRCTRATSVLLTAAGHVYCCTQGGGKEWTKAPVPPVSRFALNLEGTQGGLLTESGELWYFGAGIPGELPTVFSSSLRERTSMASARRLSSPHHKRVLSCSASSDSLCFVTENGRAYWLGTNWTLTHPDTGLVLGLEQVSLISVTLGKTHAVGISKHGVAYTWGSNNLFQCGRSESLQPQRRSEGPRQEDLCSPSEHLWVKDVATLCVRCGLCSAHGTDCSKKDASLRAGYASCGSGEAGCLRCGLCRRCGEESVGFHSLPEETGRGRRRSAMRQVLRPAKLTIPGPREVKIRAAACGNYHTLLLGSEGEVYSFGANCHGQLGVGDTKRRVGPQWFCLPKGEKAVQIAAGGVHSVVRTASGLVYTCGSNKRGQLGRKDVGKQWQARPDVIQALVGPRRSVAIWIGATVDSTFLRVEKKVFKGSVEELIVCGNARAFVFMERDCAANKQRYAVVERRSGRIRSFCLDQCWEEGSWYLDPAYDLLWHYAPAKDLISGLTYWNLRNNEDFSPLQNPQSWLPIANGETEAQTAQLSLSLLTLLHAQATLGVEEGGGHDSAPPRTVSRYRNFGGGWGYSAQSVEAVQFQPSRNIQVLGYGLFGGRGEYTAKIKLLALSGNDSDERSLELLAESEETFFETLPQEKAQLQFPTPVLCNAGATYVAWAQINGPSSDCGAGGQVLVTGEDGTIFKFRNSRLSNNGTDVHVGQIPLILYKSLGEDPVEGTEFLRTSTLRPASLDFIPLCLSILELTLSGLNAEASERDSASLLARTCFRLLRLFYQPNWDSKESGRRRLASILLRFYSTGESLVEDDSVVAVMEEAVETEKTLCAFVYSSIEGLHDEVVARMRGRDGWAGVALTQTLATNHCVVALLGAMEGFGSTGSGKRKGGFLSFLRFVVENALRDEEAGSVSEAKLETTAVELLAEICQELLAIAKPNARTPILCTATRFSRSSSQPSWDSGAGVPDAIGFTVDIAGLNLHGVAVYVGGGASLTYTLEALMDQGDGFQESWLVLEKVSGVLEVGVSRSLETGLIAFHKAVKLLPGATYALRLLLQGGKTWSGQGGIPRLNLPSGGSILFRNSPLSLNGTSISRGQIPSILYSVSNERGLFRNHKEVLHPKEAIRWFLLLLRCFCNRLHQVLRPDKSKINDAAISTIVAWSCLFLEQYPDKALDVLGSIEELLPVLADINAQRKLSLVNTMREPELRAFVESAHPYKAAELSSWKIKFEESVAYLSLEFDSKCSTAAGDVLSVYWSRHPNKDFHLVGRFSGKNWPEHIVLIPGSALWLFLESGPRTEKPFGFRINVKGFVGTGAGSWSRAERELCWLANSALRFMLEKEEGEISPGDIKGLLRKTGSLLRGGLNFAHDPSIREVVLGELPGKKVSPELRFLSDFVVGSKSTAAGRLSRWLWSEAFIDLDNSQLTVAAENAVVGQPTLLNLSLRDQFGRPATTPQLQVEATVWRGKEPSSTPEMERIPVEETSYQPVYLNKARYVTITMLPSLQDFSLEELRLAFSQDSLQQERFRLLPAGNADYAATWVPKHSGSYVIQVKLDGCKLPQHYNFSVDKGLVASTHRGPQKSPSKSKAVTVSRMIMTGGVRIRKGPSRSQRQLGLVPRGSTVSYVEELSNREGIWLRLSDESALLYSLGQFPNTSWVLFRSNVPPRSYFVKGSGDEMCSLGDMSTSLMVSAEERYSVLGVEVPVREAPGLLFPPIATMTSDEVLLSDGWLHNRDGVWISLHRSSRVTCKGYCLAQDNNGTEFLRKLSTSIRMPSSEGAGESAVFKSVLKPKPIAHVWPRPAGKVGSGPPTVKAIPPSGGESVRAAFAALLWHEGLVHDAIASAAYLKFHPELGTTHPTEMENGTVPPTMQMFSQMWDEVSSRFLRKSGRGSLSASTSRPRDGNLCELCDRTLKRSLIEHMLSFHPGCGSHAGGRGYNSMGRYTSGWTGNCGEGGGPHSTWYLLCAPCRDRYRSERLVPSGVSHARLKENACFLLELNPSVEQNGFPQKTSTYNEWTIDLFPDSPASTERDTTSTCFLPESKHHTSDPGPKQTLPLTMGIWDSEPSYLEHGGKPMETVLTSPSAALQALMNPERRDGTAESEVLSFVGSEQQVDSIRATMKASTRRGAMLSHAFRVWNWMLRLVSGEECVKDVVWTFLTCLSSMGKHRSGLDAPLLLHPLQLCGLAGPSCRGLLKNFHAFLHTIAMILQSVDVDPELQRLCFRTWMFRLTSHEQSLILSSHLLSGVGRVMSLLPSPNRLMSETTVLTQELKDLSCTLLLEPSSRTGMGVCLTDGSCDTFWESGEEDRNRSKFIHISRQGPRHSCVLGIYLDNVKDEGYAVSQLTLHSQSREDGSEQKELLKRTSLSLEFCGWIQVWIGTREQVMLELRGPESFLRVRQIVLLGETEPKRRNSPPANCEAAQNDALQVFQAITSQAFGYDSHDEANGALRQEIFDLMFSRSRLDTLQGYVSSQVTLALEREIHLLSGQEKRSFSYCHGLLQMLNRVLEAPEAVHLLESRGALLISLSALLLFAPLSLQRLALNALQKLILLSDPLLFDVGVFCDTILVLTLKLITIQIRDKRKHNGETHSAKSALVKPPVWWRLEVDGRAELIPVIAAVLDQLLSGGPWSAHVTSLLSHHILTLQSILVASADSHRHWFQEKDFWMGLGALVLVRDEKLLSAAVPAAPSEEETVFCENHDDGVSQAEVFCETCSSALCRACYSVLHLNKKARAHSARRLAHNHTAPQLRLHEGFVRVKHPGFLINLDTASLHGILEIHSSRPQSRRCRFCQNAVDEEDSDACSHSECQALLPLACSKTHPCGHRCGGLLNEVECLPCLECKTHKDLHQDSDDLCVICFTDRLSAAPAIQLSCGHVFHYLCAKATLQKRWPGPRVTFGFIKCPLCQKEMHHPSLNELLEPIRLLLEEVIRKARLRLDYDGLAASEAVTEHGSPFYNDPDAYALHRYVYVLCSKCGQAYFGGEAQCQEALATSQYDPEELVCGACSDISRTEICPKHGTQFLEYKCRFCCSIAVFFCFGTTHFCTGCHDDFQKVLNIPKHQLSHCPAGPRGIQLEGNCPLKLSHPPTGEEFPLGCAICRNLSTF